MKALIFTLLSSSLGTEPNVMPFSYDVDPSIPDDLVQLIPNRCVYGVVT